MAMQMWIGRQRNMVSVLGGKKSCIGKGLKGTILQITGSV